MIVGKPFDMMVERVDAGGSTNTGLAHRAAEPLLPAPGVVDEVACAGKHAADRRAQPLGEIDPGRIPSRRHVARGNPGRDAGIEQACAVHMGRQTVCPGDLHDLIERSFLPDRAAADIGGLLGADHRLRRLVTGARMQRPAEGVGCELTVCAGKRRDLEAAERCMCAAFTRDDMRALMRQDLVAGPAMHQRRRDVAHGP